MPASARVLAVGPERTLKQPSEAAVVAAAGDVVRIDPGNYTDCAVWNAPRLVIEAVGGPVRLAGKVCAQKGIFVVESDSVTIRGLTFANAMNAEHNAAGIRLGGRNLTVDHCQFLDNENGILAGGGADSTLLVTDSLFAGNGACINACAHGVYAGAPIGLLDVERSVFQRTHAGHHIKSRALKTVVRGNRIEDGPDGTSSYLIDAPNGGDLLIENNTMEKGPRTENHEAAISIGEEGVKNPTHSLIVRGNRFRSDMPSRTVFVRNAVPVRVELRDNVISGDVQALGGPAH